MTELDDAIERFARPRRGVAAVPEESVEVAAGWALEALLGETLIALRRRKVEPIVTVMESRNAAGGPVFTSVTACWPMEIFALTPRGVALPYTMLTSSVAGIEPRPRLDAPVVCVRPQPITVGSDPGDVEVNRRGQLLWRWADDASSCWTAGFRERFEANWSEHRPGSLVDPIAFAIVDHLDGRIERGVVH